jgi:hypothetical protein
VQIVVHNGTTPGQMALLALVPERGFAVAIFTNANPLGGRLQYDVSTWALQRFLGLSTSLPPTYDLPTERLTEFVGRYGCKSTCPEAAAARSSSRSSPTAADCAWPIRGRRPRAAAVGVRTGWPFRASRVFPRRRRAGHDRRPDGAGGRLHP